MRHVLAGLAVMPKHGVMDALVIDGMACGAMVAQHAISVMGKADGVQNIDWSAWTPGDVGVAQGLLSGAGAGDVLQSLLDEADITIQSVASTSLNQLATAIAESIGTGTTNRDLASQISSLLDDPSRADMVAATETTRVMTAGSMDTYDASGALWISFMSAEDNAVCPLCEENDGVVVTITGQFPNGMPPVHPNCRCTILPATGPNG